MALGPERETAMRKLLRFWHEEVGSVIAGEWAFIVTILLLGAVTGAVASRLAGPPEVEEPEASPVAPAPGGVFSQRFCPPQ
jgi:hypothetical protein